MVVEMKLTGSETACMFAFLIFFTLQWKKYGILLEEQIQG
jgi:hypothetical protein